jgi:uncharacterized protein YoxC
MLVHHLEQLADAVKAVCKACASLEAKQRKNVTAVLGALEQDYLDTMKAVHEKNKTLADDVARRRVQRADAAAALAVPDITHGCTAISSLLSDIARLVIDKELAQGVAHRNA